MVSGCLLAVIVRLQSVVCQAASEYYSRKFMEISGRVGVRAAEQVQDRIMASPTVMRSRSSA